MLIESHDYLQDVAFDFYSNKMAVCSSDRRIQIFKRKTDKLVDMPVIYNNNLTQYYENPNNNNNENININENVNTNTTNNNISCNIIHSSTVGSNFNNWKLESCWEAHDAPITKVIFSAPEYGSLLASCGFDKRVNIWQEKIENGKSVWICKQKIQEFSDNVEDISFCPKVNGLKLAVCTYNGKIKIFEPKDYSLYVNWNCIIQKDVSLSCSSICWNLSPLDPQSFVLGCYNNLSNSVSLYNNKGSNNKDNDNNININDNNTNNNNNNNKEINYDSVIPSTNNINSSIKDNLIQIFVLDNNKKDFICYANLTNSKGHSDSISYLEWAPQFGRSYHMIASCGLDKKIIIWKFNIDFDENFNNCQINPKLITNMLCIETENRVHRVSFNVSGTILSSNDSNGLIKIFRKDENEFKQIYEFKSNINNKKENENEYNETDRE